MNAITEYKRRSFTTGQLLRVGSNVSVILWNGTMPADIVKLDNEIVLLLSKPLPVCDVLCKHGIVNLDIKDLMSFSSKFYNVRK